MNNFHAFPVWDRVIIGNGARTSDDFNRLYRDGRSWERSAVNDSAGVLTHPSFAVAEVETELDLVLIRVQDLGFISSSRGRSVNRRAFEMGLRLCPVEVPFQVMAQIRNWRNVLWSILPSYGRKNSGDLQPFVSFATEPFVFSAEHRVGGLEEASFYLSEDQKRETEINTLRSHFGAFEDGYWDPNDLMVYIRPRL